MHGGLVGYSRKESHVGADEEAGEDVAQDERLLQGFGNYGEHSRRDQYHGEVTDYVQFFGHRSLSW